MTVRVNRTFEVDLPRERAWELLSDPGKRAEVISVVESYERHGGPDNEMTWHIGLPVRALGTVSVSTRDLERDPPRFVKFQGKSRVMNVVGEHELTPQDGGTRVANRFVVDSKIPGIERYFERNLDAELDNIERALRAYIDEGDGESGADERRAGE